MNNQFKFLFMFVAVVLTTPQYSFAKDAVCDNRILKMDNEGTNSVYQHDMDIIRLRHIKSIGELIEEYFSIKGYYPLSAVSDAPTYVFIASKWQRRYIPNNAPPYPHRRIRVKDLEKELSKVLARKIKLPRNPQKIPIHKPNFYTYNIRNGEYLLTAHLHGSYAFTHPEDKYAHKVSVSSTWRSDSRYHGYTALIESSDFQNALNREFCR